ncbi:MAG: VWA domain-containing protein [Epsilonproteobacteria bacterium]|nr:VWA domain-containing protein [Campylobacterota bacterium]
MSNLTFEYPYLFLILILFIICAKWCKPKSEAILFPHLEIFLESVGNRSLMMRLLKWTTITTALIALASPVVEDKVEIEKKDGYAITLVLDASGSMRYGFESRFIGQGLESKFDVSIQMAQEFIEKRGDDQLGLVVFGNYAYVAAPLTYDKEILGQIMGGLQSGIAGSNYTVINDALFQSAKLFKESDAKTKIAILLTDGESRGDNVPFDVAMRLTEQHNVKVYTIGIGSQGEFNDEHLKLIADKTNGKFFSASNKNTLKNVYNMIDELEKSEIESEKYVKKSYYFEYPLFLAFIALLFYTYLLNKRSVA